MNKKTIMLLVKMCLSYQMPVGQPKAKLTTTVKQNAFILSILGLRPIVYERNANSDNIRFSNSSVRERKFLLIKATL